MKTTTPRLRAIHISCNDASGNKPDVVARFIVLTARLHGWDLPVPTIISDCGCVVALRDGAVLAQYLAPITQPLNAATLDPIERAAEAPPLRRTVH